MTTDTEPATDPTTEALRGPWQAVLAWRDGYLTTWDDVDEPGDVRIQIVRDTAAPIDRDGDGMPRLPGTYNGADLLADWDGEDFEDLDEVRARWVQAQAMAVGLNAALEVLAR